MEVELSGSCKNGSQNGKAKFIGKGESPRTSRAGSQWNNYNRSDWEVGERDKLRNARSNQGFIGLSAGLSGPLAEVEFDPRKGAVDQKGRPITVVSHRFLKGSVIAVNRPESQWTPLDWARLSTRCWGSTFRDVFGWSFLNGSQPTGFEIHSVGRPPIITFMFLIFGFAIVVGPVFYTFLNRIKRVQWLVFVIPTFSIFVSLLLLFFILLKDGVYLKSKRVSVTVLDQREGNSLTHTAQALFQGVSPGSYSLQKDCMVKVAAGRFDTIKADYHSGGQTVRSRVISARSKHQVVTMNSSFTDKKIQISKENGKWMATNNLGVTVKAMITRIDGQLFIATNLKDSDSVELEKFTETEWSEITALKDSMMENCYRKELVYSNSYSYRRSYPYGDEPANSGDRLFDSVPRFDSTEHDHWGLVGQSSVAMTRHFGKGGRDVLTDISSNEYIAFCNDSPFAVSLSDSVSYEYQLHVIHGKW